MPRRLVLVLLVLATASLALALPAHAEEAADSGVAPFAKDLSVLWVLPFAGLLLGIALFPLFAPHWWERHRNKALVAGVCAILVLVLLVAERERGGISVLEHALGEYVAFIVLLGALFVISGGILVTGDLRATPRNNVVLLALGGVLANVVGTTGASMLLIRPLIRINGERRRTYHTVIFFIFVVSNVGGCLTPLGDPPLFLGYLEGVPFSWTLGLWKEWAMMLSVLLLIFWIIDSAQYRRERPEDVRLDETRIEPVRVRGLHNVVFLLGIMAAIVMPGLLHLHEAYQVLGMLLMALLAYWSTPKEIREANAFSWDPILEVAVLFVGIFVAMVPALQYLQVHGAALGLREPWHFFFATGSLSSFLDNAPTYLTFVTVAAGVEAAAPAGGPLIHMTRGAVPETFLVAISLGAVFMGAMTYIGNGPNFMVKAIAERAGQRMPSFFGYVLWSLAILGPLYVLVAFVLL